MRLRMTRGQVVTILACLIPLYALVAVDAWQRHQGPATRGTGYVLSRDVAAGTVLTGSDLDAIPLTYSTSDFAYLTEPPLHAIVGKPLHQGTLLSQDDLLPTGAGVAEVTIQAVNPPPLTPGALIDVYLQTAADFRRVGAHLPVVATSPLTIQVPTRDAAAWLALSASHLPMLVSVTTDTSASGPDSVDTCTAISELSAEPCAGTSRAPATPSPSPTVRP